MIRKLSFEVTFANGGTLAAEHDFPQGVIAIHGANERGKSMRIEMIRWLLFGTKALRGAASDYRKLGGELTFVANGKVYMIKRRNSSSAKLWEGETLLATGTKAVNAKVIEVLGYDLTVFDIANNCLQGEVEALSAMKPTARRAMVDQTIGLNVLDELIKHAGERAAADRKAGEAVKAVLVEPVEPVKPANYAPVKDLQKEHTRLARLLHESQEIRGWLSRPFIMMHPPGPAPHSVPIVTMERLQANREEVLNQIRAGEAKLEVLRSCSYTLQQIMDLEAQAEAHDRWWDAQAKLARFQNPQYTREELGEMRGRWMRIAAWESAEAIRQRITEAKREGEHECPNCRHRWPVAVFEIRGLEERLAAIEAPDERPENPPLIEREISEALSDLDKWGSSTAERAKLAAVPYVDPPEVDLDQVRRDFQDQVRRSAIEDELETLRGQLADLPDFADLIREAERWETERRKYDEWYATYQAYEEEKKKKEKRLEEIGNVDRDFVEVDRRLQEARAYEEVKARYDVERAVYDDNKAKADELLASAEQYEKARKGLRILKVEVKQFLVPSLNKVASHLLSLMTGGERSLVEVDEEFEIKIDGQPINTLSGSGKAVANLAIRIALGQVLTAKVMSLFMGDEIDASMDADRAAYTVQCLQNLKSRLDQIILVSHKEIEADHHIRL